MSESTSDPRPGVTVTRQMLHDLVNHLTIALGHSDLLLLELDDTAPDRPALEEISRACRRAVDMVDLWRAELQREP